MDKTSKNFKKFKKTPLVIALLLLAVSFAGLLVLLRGIDTNNSAAAAAKEEWRKEALRRSEIQALDRVLGDTVAERQKLDTHFATRENVVPFLDSIESLARQAGADPEVISIDETPDKNTLVVIIRADGSWSAVYKFLELLENSPYELEFLATEIGRQGEGEENGAWEAFFKIKILTLSLNMKLELFKKQKKFKKGGFHTNPNIGWELIFFLGLALAGGLFAWGMLMYIHASRELGASPIAGDTNTVGVKKERLGKVLEYFEVREKRSAEIISSPAAIVDPSL